MVFSPTQISGSIGSDVVTTQQGNDQIAYFWLNVPWLDKNKQIGDPMQIQCFTKRPFQQTLSVGDNVLVEGSLRLIKPNNGGDAYARIDFSFGQVQMSSSLMATNSVVIAGNIGQEPETKYRENAPALCKFTLAVNTGKDTKPDWQNVILWGKIAERGQKCLHKGSSVTVAGVLELERWVNKTDNAPRHKFQIKGQNFILQSSKAKGNNQAQGNAAPVPMEDEF